MLKGFSSLAAKSYASYPAGSSSVMAQLKRYAVCQPSTIPRAKAI